MFGVTTDDILKDLRRLHERAKTADWNEFPSEPSEFRRNLKDEMREMQSRAEQYFALQRKARKGDLNESELETLVRLHSDLDLKEWLEHAPPHRDEDDKLRMGKKTRGKLEDERFERLDADRKKFVEGEPLMETGGPGGFPTLTAGGFGNLDPDSPETAEIAGKLKSLISTYNQEKDRREEIARLRRQDIIDDQKGLVSSQQEIKTSHDNWWSLVKNQALTTAQWNEQGSSGTSFMPDSSQNTSGGDGPQTDDPESKRRKAEMDHSLSVNNQSTQQWFDSILPDALEFRSKLAAAVQTPGVAIHDPNHSKNIKPMMRAGEKLDEMIAHITSHKTDTPGHGRGNSGIPSIVSGENDGDI
tara:strand:- start:7832 stop:8905 length:1074 start_codon:yes stop_codon:yes gene_type:complete